MPNQTRIYLPEPEFKIRWSKKHPLCFSYYNAKTGFRYGEWDLFAITDKGNSRLPPKLFYRFLRQLRILRKYSSRTMDTLRACAIESGNICGFEPKVEGKIIYWQVRYEGHTLPVVAIKPVHCRWRSDRRVAKNMLRDLLQCRAPLRFVIDNNVHSGIAPMPKSEFFTGFFGRPE